MTGPQEYRKKPVTIRAMQYTGTNREEVIAWCGPSRAEYDDLLGQLLIATDEGTLRANSTDWIVQGVEGEFYPVSESVFRKTYEFPIT